MFVRVNQTPNSPRKSVQVVESRREGHKVKTKILRHVGIALDDEELDKLKSFAQDIIAKLKQEELSKQPSLFERAPSLSASSALKKRGRPAAKKIEDIIPVTQVTLDMIVEEKRIIEGVTDIAGPLYDTLGFNTLLPTKRANHLLKSLVLARLVAPKSKRQLHKLLNSSFDQDCDLDALYRLMDSLHPRIDQIKVCVFNRTQELFPKGINLMLFDVTTLYFESVTTDDLRQFGYSKDHRFNTTQVVLALATNEDGLPLGYEVFAGNTAEVRTLCATIDQWRIHLPIKDICFVGDRAMFCSQNLGLLEEKGYSYVVAARLRSLPKDRQRQILNASNYRVEAFAQEIGWVGEFDLGNRRLITSYKTKRALNDANSRQQILDKISKALDKSKETGKLISNNGIKKYTQTLSKSETILDMDKIQADADWDGIHGVITNLKDTSAQEILQRYARLWMIEESFRINKHNLKMRPIYHWKKERIESHVALCYMSFAVLRHLQYQVSLTQKVSPDEIMDELLNVQASIYVHTQTGDRYRVPGHTSQTATKIYKALGLIRSQNATIYQ
jgi:transposase